MRKRLPIPAKKNCAQCGNEFQPRPKYPQQRFCGHKCQWAARGGANYNARVARESAKLRGDAQRGRGSGKSYPKLYGRHAHRVIAEQKLGRPLKAGEVVHHEDENKLNYSPENLTALPSQAEHARLHACKPRKPKVICKKGLHRLEGDNLLIDAQGTRLCRACYIEKQEAYKTRLRAATVARRGKASA